MLKKIVLCASLLLASMSSYAGESWLSLEIPRIDVAEYHRPYVAIWIQSDDNSVTNIAVWYQLRDGSDKGEEWLKDMRQWWRRSGRGLDMPVDGISGATQAPGEHRVALTEVLQSLPEGEYQLRVEAAREVGGRELIDIPFVWPTDKEQVLKAQGESELGALTFHLAP